MTAVYNEIEPYAVQWLTNLIAAGHIAPGDVDDRSIRDIHPADWLGYDQVHCFAGIGIWSLALRMAGVPDDASVWTGSCPCQPFSAAGKQKGFADDRHLWPDWFGLVRLHRPDIVLGEQVASPDGLNWFDLVSSDLEGAGYAVGAADLCAAGLGAPHIRQRLWFVGIQHAPSDGREQRWPEPSGRGPERRRGAGEQRDRDRDEGRRRGEFTDDDLLGDTHEDRSQGGIRGWQDTERAHIVGPAGCDSPVDATCGVWSGADWIWCRDGKYRPVEPSTFPLAHGYPSRVGRLRAYGNAISPQVAAAFIEAALACRP